MSFHFTLSRIPELSRLSEEQLQLVDSMCLRPLLLRTKIRFAKFTCLLPFWLLTFAVVPQFWTDVSSQVAIMLVELPILYGLDHLLDMGVMSVNRRAIANFVSAYEHELR